MWLVFLRNHPYDATPKIGEVPEWTNGAVSKTVVLFSGYRGFESHPLRKRQTHRLVGLPFLLNFDLDSQQLMRLNPRAFPE